ncbi:MAG TPA: hypothetical protein DGH25_09845 [Erwiniaceae bacterium]|nr:hypothetical protein [Erwiniaceae bacterium]
MVVKTIKTIKITYRFFKDRKMSSLINNTAEKAGYIAMARNEIAKLNQLAHTISSRHLNYGPTLHKFISDTKSFAEQHLNLISRAQTAAESMNYLEALKSEINDLHIQDRLLTTGKAKVFAVIDFVRDHQQQIKGYVITGVHIATSASQVVGGALLVGTLSPVGVVAGGILVVNGINGIDKEIERLFTDNKTTEGFLADAYMGSAEAMGFERCSGLAVYNTVDLAANAFSVYGLIKKKESWRLFYSLREDFYRNYDKLSQTKRLQKNISLGLKGKSVLDIMSGATCSR